MPPALHIPLSNAPLLAPYPLSLTKYSTENRGWQNDKHLVLHNFSKKNDRAHSLVFQSPGKREVLAVSKGVGEDRVGGSADPHLYGRRDVWEEAGPHSFLSSEMGPGGCQLQLDWGGEGWGLLLRSPIPDFLLPCCILSCPHSRVQCCTSA